GKSGKKTNTIRVARIWAKISRDRARISRKAQMTAAIQAAVRNAANNAANARTNGWIVFSMLSKSILRKAPCAQILHRPGIVPSFHIFVTFGAAVIGADLPG